MKKKRFLLTACCIFLALLFWGCGDGGPGPPGSEGTADTGVILDIVINPETKSIDAFQEMCSETTYEDFTDQFAEAVFTARMINPTGTNETGILYIEKYTVEYRRSTDSIGAPPIESDTRYVTIEIPPLTSATPSSLTSAGVILFDLIRKDHYATDMLSGQYTSAGFSYLNNYTAIYTFYGKNQFGTEFSVKATVDIQVGDFDNC
jgi:hypothetical protein